MVSLLTNVRARTSQIGTPALSRMVMGLLMLAIVLLLAVNVATMVMNQRTIVYNDAVAHSEKVRLAAKDLLILLTDAETSQRGYMLTAQPAYLNDYDAALSQLPTALDNLGKLIGDDPVKKHHFESLKANFDDRLNLMTDTVNHNSHGRIGMAVSLVRSGRGKALTDAMRVDLMAIDDIEADYLVAQTQKSEAASRMTVLGNLMAGLLILALAVISIWMVRRYIREIQAARIEVDRANAGLENEVRDRTAELVRANEEIQRFAYIVSHDLRAPLVNVMGYTSELEQVGILIDAQLTKLAAADPDLVDEETARAVREDVPEAIGFIRASTTKMDRLINAILRMSREGRRPLTPQPLNMQEMLDTMVDAVSHQVLDSDGEIRVGDVPDIISDRLVIEQVFGNLIDNAIKYHQTGRPLRVEIEGETLDDDTVLVRVSDNGRGISSRDHERIFELFRRAGAQDQPGEGLGLAFVRNSVRRLGGSIDLESEVGIGSTFLVKLPKHLTLARVQGDSL
ncbi:CHASE3 domain-containing protein [Brevundimonas vesicularis]|uniref:sensor histidine kinase n=1 Tax=Brevundimonas vesicularis TaxID=41276 RepID=UPI0038D42547